MHTRNVFALWMQDIPFSLHGEVEANCEKGEGAKISGALKASIKRVGEFITFRYITCFVYLYSGYKGVKKYLY